jgi:hypothetical protein
MIFIPVVRAGLPAVLPLIFIVILDDQSPAVSATLAAVYPADIAPGNRVDFRSVAYGAVQPLHNRYMSDLEDNNRVE